MAREDYNFSAFADWPKHALKVAWLWELEREMESSRGPFYPAWQIHELERIEARLKSNDVLGDEIAELLPKGYELTDASFHDALSSIADEILERKKAYFDDRQAVGKSKWISRGPIPPRPMLYSHVLTEVASLVRPDEAWRKEIHPGMLSNGGGACGAYVRVHALEIDWTKTEGELIDAFKNWLRNGYHSFLPDQQLYSRDRKGKRETAGLLSYLRDLAIYRISEAKITHKEGLKKLGLKMSAQNWEHAQARTKEKIRGRIAQLCQLAKLQAVGGGEEAYWKDMFIGWDALDDPPCV